LIADLTGNLQLGPANQAIITNLYRSSKIYRKIKIYYIKKLLVSIFLKEYKNIKTNRIT